MFRPSLLRLENASHQGSTDNILLSYSLGQFFAKATLLTLVVVATAWAYSPNNTLDEHKPKETLEFRVSAKESIIYESGVPIPTAVQCRRYVATTLASIGSIEVYRMPLTSDTYFV